MSETESEASGEKLGGGVAHVGEVVRYGDQVERPASEHSASIHHLLRYVRARGFDGAPRPLSLNARRERLGYIRGEVPTAPFPSWWKSDGALASTASLLRAFHDASEDLVTSMRSGWSAELADPHGAEVICHNDVCPENVVYKDGVAIAFLDFDFAAPGRRVYDLAQLAKMCCPLDAPGRNTRTGLDDLDPLARMRVVADAYGLPPGRTGFVDAIMDAVEVGDEFVRRHIARGETGFLAMWQANGGEERIQQRLHWLHSNHQQLVDAIG